jgi:hypothetical protein
METEKIMERILADQKAFINEFLAEVKANQEKADANVKELKEDLIANQAKKEARLERMETLLGLRPCEVAIEACPENSKAGLEEMEAAMFTFEGSSDDEETEAAAEQQKLRNEGMKVDTVGSLENRHMDQHLTVRRRRRRKKRTQGNEWVRQKLAATRKRMIYRAVPAVRKGRIRKKPSKVMFLEKPP